MHVENLLTVCLTLDVAAGEQATVSDDSRIYTEFISLLNKNERRNLIQVQ